MAEKGGTKKKNNKRNSYILTGIILIIIILSSGCLNYFEDEVSIEYEAYYDESLNFSNITTILDQNNISYTNNEIVISFLFGKGINNNSIETAQGTILNKLWTNQEYSSKLIIELNHDNYPWIKKDKNSKAKLDKRKPIL